MTDKKAKKNSDRQIEDEIDYEALYKRALADYQNLMKQSAKEKSELSKYANEQIVMELLPVYDNLRVALDHAGCGNGSANGIEAGVGYVVKQWRSILETNGVSEIKAMGEHFDHATMEAVETDLTDEKEDEGKVSRVLKPGYAMNGKVLFPARVAVYKLNC
jgi:molecular chaperone GrpE